MHYNELAKALLRGSGIAPKEIRSVFILSGRDFSNSRATAYFKGNDNPRFYEMNFETFRDWVFGAAKYKGISVQTRPADFGECIELIEILLPGIGLSNGMTPENTCRAVDDYCKRSE